MYALSFVHLLELAFARLALHRLIGLSITYYLHPLLGFSFGTAEQRRTQFKAM